MNSRRREILLGIIVTSLSEAEIKPILTGQFRDFRIRNRNYTYNCTDCETRAYKI